MDLKSHSRWCDYSRAGRHVQGDHTPWHAVRSDDKKRARLYTIAHLLSQVPYEEAPRETPVLPKRQKPQAYVDPDYPYQFAPELEWREC